MESQLPKKALVTGGNRGIGFAIAQGLIKENYQVFITSRSIEAAQRAANQLGRTVIPMELDLSQDSSIQQAAAMVVQHSDYLNVLINNAGVYLDKDIDILSISRQRLEMALSTNTFGVIQMVQKFLPLLRNAQAGKIINVSSEMGLLTGLTTTAPSYCLSKLALNGVTLMLSQSLQKSKISVYAVDPGWVKTDMGGNTAPRLPEQGADTVLWLATQTNQALSGKIFRDRQEISY